MRDHRYPTRAELDAACTDALRQRKPNTFRQRLRRLDLDMTLCRDCEQQHPHHAAHCPLLHYIEHPEVLMDFKETTDE